MSLKTAVETQRVRFRGAGMRKMRLTCSDVGPVRIAWFSPLRSCECSAFQFPVLGWELHTCPIRSAYAPSQSSAAHRLAIATVKSSHMTPSDRRVSSAGSALGCRSAATPTLAAVPASVLTAPAGGSLKTEGTFSFLSLLLACPPPVFLASNPPATEYPCRNSVHTTTYPIVNYRRSYP